MNVSHYLVNFELSPEENIAMQPEFLSGEEFFLNVKPGDTLSYYRVYEGNLFHVTIVRGQNVHFVTTLDGQTICLMGLSEYRIIPCHPDGTEMEDKQQEE